MKNIKLYGGGYLKKTSQRLLLPYFATLFVFYFCWIMTEKPVVAALGPLFKTLSVGWLYSCGNVVTKLPRITPIGPLWFLTCLFITRFLFYFLLKISEKYNEISTQISLLIMIILGWFGIYIGTKLFLPWSLDIAFVALYFMFAGYYLNKFKLLDKFYSLIPLLLLALLWVIDIQNGGLSLNNREYFQPLLSLNGAVAASILVIGISKFFAKFNSKIVNLINYLGKYSLIILIFHAQDVYYFHLDKFIPHFYLITSNLWFHLIFRMLLSILSIEIIKSISVLRYVYCEKTKND